MLEATDYLHYWNASRLHTGRCMDSLTPFEKLSRSNLTGLHHLLFFPVLLVEQQLALIRLTTESVLAHAHLSQQAHSRYKYVNPLLTLQTHRFLPTYAQKVLTQYPIDGKNY